MTLENMKKKIYALLSIDEKTKVPALCYAIDSAQRKVAVLGKCIRKETEITFVLGKADAPADFICPAGDEPSVDFFDGRLTLAPRENKTVIMTYYAYPAEVTDETPDATELSIDGTAADAAVYCAAAELCSSVRPGDVRRYMELMTEYDERMAGICADSVKSIKPTVFAGRRLK